jgi:hypothetical protein
MGELAWGLDCERANWVLFCADADRVALPGAAAPGLPSHPNQPIVLLQSRETPIIEDCRAAVNANAAVAGAAAVEAGVG